MGFKPPNPQDPNPTPPEPEVPADKRPVDPPKPKGDDGPIDETLDRYRRQDGHL